MQDINQLVEMIYKLKNQGKNPNEVYQMLINKNPNYNMALTRYQNMSQGRNPKQFLSQIALQNGATEETLKMIEELCKN